MSPGEEITGEAVPESGAPEEFGFIVTNENSADWRIPAFWAFPNEEGGVAEIKLHRPTGGSTRLCLRLTFNYGSDGSVAFTANAYIEVF